MLCRVGTLTIRTEQEVEAALDDLTSRGKTRSEVVREAILSAHRDQRHAGLRAEAASLRADADDVAASRRLASEMDADRAW